MPLFDLLANVGSGRAAANTQVSGDRNAIDAANERVTRGRTTLPARNPRK